jgi:hypothetical protein
MEFEFMDSVSYCDERINNVLYSNMYMLGLLTTGLAFVTYQYGRLEDELKKYREKEANNNLPSDDEVESSDSETDVVDESEKNEPSKDESEGVKTRSWYSYGSY